MALRDVMDHAVRVQREITAPGKRPNRRGRRILGVVICVPLIALCAYSWIAKPGFIWGTTARADPARVEADMRFSMYVLAQRLEEFRATEGAFPASLAAIGEPDSLVAYRQTSDSTFELRAAASGREIVFRSTEPTEAFLGRSLALITGREP